MLARSALYWRTARYLKPRQMAHQILHRLKPHEFAPLSKTGLSVRAAPGATQFNPRAPNHGDKPWGFRFLNTERTFPDGSIDWVCADMPKLWRYNLHYFDYLRDPNRSEAERLELVNHWIRHNPPGTQDAWESYTVSLRIVNWIMYFMSTAAPGIPLPLHWSENLGSQCAWLRRNIEYHLMANHLFKNGKALVFAGAFFEGPAADEWLQKGSEILIEQLEEQFLSDGGHYERSPMYHAIMLEDLLDLIALARAVPNTIAATVLDALTRKSILALAFLRDLTLPDHEIALFNDAAHGIAASTQSLFSYAARLVGTQPTYSRAEGELIDRPASGYFGWCGPTDAWLIDCGSVGPDYQPGHTHCDTLSYELLMDSRRVVVDTGVFDYEPGERRHRSRTTAGHNTVMVDGAEQSEIWGVFRVARRARAIDARVAIDRGRVSFVGAHDGYCRLPGSVVHRRTAEYAPNRCLEICDELRGHGFHVMESRVHFAPGLHLSRRAGALEVRDDADVLVAMVNIGEGPSIHVEHAEQYPGFGRAERIDVLRLRSEGVLPLRQQYSIARA
jgi:uncharacterized heparinase superfamily protein